MILEDEMNRFTVTKIQNGWLVGNEQGLYASHEAVIYIHDLWQLDSAIKTLTEAHEERMNAMKLEKLSAMTGVGGAVSSDSLVGL